MPFRIAITGINAALTGLRTTANNIANVSTAGFKQSRAEFAELSATGTPTGGSGVRTARIAQQPTQSATQSSGNTLEASNVDLTEQLLNMIQFSLQLKAQAKVIHTASENAETITVLVGERDSK